MRNQFIPVHPQGRGMLTPNHPLNFGQTSDPNSPLSPLPRMVVNLRSAHSNPSKVKNISAHSVNVVFFKSYIKTDPLMDKLTNPIQNEQRH